MRDGALVTTLKCAEAALFDFDGPICDVFSGIPAPVVARELAALSSRHDSALNAKLHEANDPMEVLRIAFEANKELGLCVETVFTEIEIKAVEVAGDPTNGSVAALRSVIKAGLPVAVVSNNSAECVAAFLERHALDRCVSKIIGRPLHRPDLMKPNPYSLFRAASLLDVAPEACVLIGDSVSDIQAAHLAGGTAIGYANKPNKLDAFVRAGAEAVTEDMGAIAHAIWSAEWDGC